MTQESKRHDPNTAELPAKNQCGTQSPEEDSPPGKRKSGRKHLNNLNAKEWIKFTKSWFILSGKADREKTAAHPATFPVELPTEFIEFFTRRSESVLDPFAGTGTTLVAADSLNRNSTGIELEPEFIKFAHQRTAGTIHEGDALSLLKNPAIFPSNHFDYVFTSPPYMNALHKSRGGNKDTRHKHRSERGRTTRLWKERKRPRQH